MKNILESVFFKAILANALCTVTTIHVKPTRICGTRPFESWSECPMDCVPRTCDDVGSNFPCLKPSPNGECPVKPACVCVFGFVRDRNGYCIPIRECPSCGGDPFAISGCGVCRKTCFNYKSTTVARACPLPCEKNGCECREKLVLDTKLRKCVTPIECSTECGPDEVFSNCINEGCYRARTCKDLENGKDTCNIPYKCLHGCLCKEGFLRLDNGTCVPENMCPESICKNDHEIFVDCDVTCAPQTCAEAGFPVQCLLPPDNECPGKPACLCKSGYLRDQNGMCIPQSFCPSCGGDDNGRPGNELQCRSQCLFIGQKDCPEMCDRNTCKCKEGFMYSYVVQKCVPDFSKFCYEDNETYDLCPDPCDPDTCKSIFEKPLCLWKPHQKKCNPACRCKNGYYRNGMGICVAAKECFDYPVKK